MKTVKIHCTDIEYKWIYFSISLYIYARFCAEHSVRVKIIWFSATVYMYVGKPLQR